MIRTQSRSRVCLYQICDIIYNVGTISICFIWGRCSGIYKIYYINKFHLVIENSSEEGTDFIERM